MSREIKFRAWDKNKRTMVNGGSFFDVSQTQGVDRWVFGMDVFNHPDNVELMQYTGLEDKNGVEMYEGDIVNFSFRMGRNEPQHFEGVLVEVDPIWGSTVSADDTYSLGRCHDIEVIGNIYENKELLS